LRAAGCEVVRAEKRSGTTTEGRTELQTVLDFLRPGDVLMVTRIDRMKRATFRPPFRWNICATSRHARLRALFRLRRWCPQWLAVPIETGIRCCQPCFKAGALSRIIEIEALVDVTARRWCAVAPEKPAAHDAGKRTRERRADGRCDDPEGPAGHCEPLPIERADDDRQQTEQAERHDGEDGKDDEPLRLMPEPGWVNPCVCAARSPLCDIWRIAS
jgi:hypothetical protein